MPKYFLEDFDFVAKENILPIVSTIKELQSEKTAI